jgi:hypothetical protein
MNIPQSAIRPFEPHGMVTLKYTPEAMVYFIDKVLGIKHKYLQRIINTYGKHSSLFDLGELRKIAEEFGANKTYFSDVSKGRVDLTYTVPNDPWEHTRRFYFNLNGKPR